MPIRVAIVEDDRELRLSFEAIIEGEMEFVLKGSYASGETFMSRVEGLDSLDVVLMDINLPGRSGIECINACKPKQPQVQYLICTVFEDNANLFNALCAGATGYLLKSASAMEMVQAIRDIHGGGSPMSLSIARTLVDSVPKKRMDSSVLAKLSKRESELLHLLAEGYQYKEIGDKLGLSIETVRSYIRSIYTKLQVHSRTDAVNLLYRL